MMKLPATVKPRAFSSRVPRTIRENNNWCAADLQDLIADQLADMKADAENVRIKPQKFYRSYTLPLIDEIAIARRSQPVIPEDVIDNVLNEYFTPLEQELLRYRYVDGLSLRDISRLVPTWTASMVERTYRSIRQKINTLKHTVTLEVFAAASCPANSLEMSANIDGVWELVGISPETLREIMYADRTMMYSGSQNALIRR